MAYLHKGDSADWTKQTLDFSVPDGADGMGRVRDCDDMREYFRTIGMTMEELKQMPAYRLALRKQPWLREL